MPKFRFDQSFRNNERRPGDFYPVRTGKPATGGLKRRDSVGQLLDTIDSLSFPLCYFNATRPCNFSMTRLCQVDRPHLAPSCMPKHLLPVHALPLRFELERSPVGSFERQFSISAQQFLRDLDDARFEEASARVHTETNASRTIDVEKNQRTGLYQNLETVPGNSSAGLENQ
ncbi:uncharacterized protein LOC112212677 [Bombus impatiens]|uniref:Uncharacterized protein LOC112212677 n=1 Tax=Bombus impatiens TaxID=132113 RepID=A0A6P8KYQ7_BOMIM|nr:uncharacterized protein LOC112212677 [Bombus impatiens]